MFNFYTKNELVWIFKCIFPFWMLEYLSSHSANVENSLLLRHRYHPPWLTSSVSFIKRSARVSSVWRSLIYRIRYFVSFNSIKCLKLMPLPSTVAEFRIPSHIPQETFSCVRLDLQDKVDVPQNNNITQTYLQADICSNEYVTILVLHWPLSVS